MVEYSTMSTFAQYEPERYVSFKDKKTQRVLFNPAADVKQGKYGPQVKVSQNGKDAWLNIASKRLVDQLKNFPVGQSVTLDITQAGSGTATTYKVEPVKK